VNLERKEEGETQEEYILRKFIQHQKWTEKAVLSIENANQLWQDRRKQMNRMKNTYKEGDLVLVRYINCRKLDPFFLGPLKVIKSEFNTLTLCDPQTGEIMDRNVHKKECSTLFCLKTSSDEVTSEGGGEDLVVRQLEK